MLDPNVHNETEKRIIALNDAHPGAPQWLQRKAFELCIKAHAPQCWEAIDYDQEIKNLAALYENDDVLGDLDRQVDSLATSMSKADFDEQVREIRQKLADLKSSL